MDDPTEPRRRSDPVPPGDPGPVQWPDPSMSETPGPYRGKHRNGRNAWGPREVIAVLVIIGAFVLAIIAMVTEHPQAQIPAWLVALIGAISFYYYRNGKEK